ncbi:nitrate ABC transporter permease [Bdellovibrio bacteriovorus]|uniref:Nitrate ABC transporter permease n=1 Tax=Bdellovibrio bacteriovorus TaxID=959 RepID=A0A150WJM5_BDEBC|nr:ABC transporter permease [Bdellovibrio bacteriovorus]KYG63922.1 nitrate ABC transporter permease [Bdellovibrio bacteriovorus]
MKKHLPAFVFFIVITASLEILVQTGIFNSSLIPAPSQIVEVLKEMHTDFQSAFLESFLNVLIGFILSVIAGIFIACVFSLSDILRRAILPFAIFFQTVPIIAIAPLLVIYFGFGASTVIASSFIVSIFPMIANTLLGLESTQPSQRDLFSIYKATPWESLWHLKLPSAFNSIYAGLKVSAGLAIIGAVAGEFVAGGGLGALIDSARTQQRVDIVFAALLLLSLMGLILMGSLALIRASLLKLRPWTFTEEI